MKSINHFYPNWIEDWSDSIFHCRAIDIRFGDTILIATFKSLIKMLVEYHSVFVMIDVAFVDFDDL